jgi:hypothetical protein
MLHCVKAFCRSAAKNASGISSRALARVETKVFSSSCRRASLTENKAFAS